MNIAALLQRSEGDTLDFKVSNYRFQGAGNEEKSELLKDILALANAWKATDAYIIIGVEEKNGKPVNVPGIGPELNDADVQQFVNSKTNRPVSFAVEHVEHANVQLTVIRVSQKQARPIFLSKDFGRLKKNTVYIRHGSSTDEASPDEIAEMAKHGASAKSPKVALRFEVVVGAYTVSSDPLFRRQSEKTKRMDAFQIVARNDGDALAGHIEGSIEIPRGILYNYLEDGDLNNGDIIEAILNTKRIKLEFSNHLRAPTHSYLATPNPLEWKPLLPGRKMRLFCERTLPLREKFHQINTSINWTLAVDNCEFQQGSTSFSAIPILRHQD